MKKTHSKSTFEIWQAAYINNAAYRTIEDRNKIILQIESTNGNSFIVEIINQEDL